MKKVLVPTDFSDSARHALRYGVSFAKEYGAELVLLHVVENLTVGYASDLFPVPMAEVRVSPGSAASAPPSSGTLASCGECRPSASWLGRFSPKPKIAESGLWLEQHLGAPGLTDEAMSAVSVLCQKGSGARPTG
mgnify:CR=1 FL=1